VSIDGLASSQASFIYGVPQGSILGTLLFSLFNSFWAIYLQTSSLSSLHECQTVIIIDSTILVFTFKALRPIVRTFLNFLFKINLCVLLSIILLPLADLCFIVIYVDCDFVFDRSSFFLFR